MALQMERPEVAPDPPSRSGRSGFGIAVIVLLAVLASVLILVAIAIILGGVFLVRSSEVSSGPAVAAQVEEAVESTIPVGAIAVDADNVVWPDPLTTATGLADPQQAVETWATESLGLVDPVVGAFTDELDGAVELRTTPDGPLTMVLVRQSQTDGSWWVAGANTGELGVEQPFEGDVVTGQIAVRGTTVDPSYQVDISYRANGSDQDLVVDAVLPADRAADGSFERSLPLDQVPTGPGTLTFMVFAPDGHAVAVEAMPLSVG